MNLKRFLVVFVLLLTITGFLVVKRFGNPMAYFERGAPAIIIARADAALSGAYTIVIDDAGRGIADVSAEVTSGEQKISLEAQQYPDHPAQVKFSISLSDPRIKLPEGKAQISVLASDASFWKNSVQSKVEVILDYQKPKLELLTQQFVVSQGGSEFVIYKASDANLTKTGVRIADHFFPGFDAKLLSERFAGIPNLYAALFALPFDFSLENDRAAIVAEDSAGNASTVALSFRLNKKPLLQAKMPLKESYIRAKVEDLMPGYLRRSGQAQQRPPEMNTPEQMVAAFRTINGNYRKLLDTILVEMMKREPTPKKWKEVFIKPMGSATSSTLGEQRSYFLNSLEAGFSVHNGVDLASVSNDQVHAANDGVVVLSEEFGIYGNAVVIDHGLGIFSLYGHLSSTDGNVGQAVARGDVIGRTGQTGLAGGDHLHFEFRVRELPVTPIEWWDAKWIKDHLDGKVEAVLNQLGSAH